VKLLHRSKLIGSIKNIDRAVLLGCMLAVLHSNVAIASPCQPLKSQIKNPMTTSKWVVNPKTEAVVLITVDDLRGNKFDGFTYFVARIALELERNKYQKNRVPSPITVFACDLYDISTEQIAGLENLCDVEVHTISHTCPLVSTEKGKEQGLIDARNEIQRSMQHISSSISRTPIAFRVPCCDSQNSVPIELPELLSANNLSVDSSVCGVFTAKPGTNTSGRKYLAPGFLNFISDYPYPYLVAGRFWEIPFCSPSDYQSFAKKESAAVVLNDWKYALDQTVRMHGTMPLLVHNNDWVSLETISAFITYARERYGERIEFMTVREVYDLLQKSKHSQSK
jgi:hypothetical protein